MLKSQGMWGCNMNEKVLLKIDEAASILGVARVTVYRLVWRGLLRPVYIGRAVRIPRSEVERFARELVETGRVQTQ
jgi:excisionase family DNA binding protein